MGGSDADVQVTVCQGGDTVVLALHGELDLAMALRIEADVLLALNALFALRRSVIFPAPRSRTVPSGSQGMPRFLPKVNALPEVRPEAPADVIPLPNAFPVTFPEFVPPLSPSGPPEGFPDPGSGGNGGAAHEKTLMIDLRHVTFMDCSGLDLLCRVRDQLTERGGRMVLMNLRPLVIRLLKLAALREPFELIGQVEGESPGA
ncbi:STAS domain-containing protein [Streptomyces niger]|uniref:STAS domain-containing protein n=1 Tax=Streptomyces niger TaxID=66373 RepID=UPI001F1E4C04|nr:STAS domain-containing protein [Streptomyces niger]